MLFHCQALVLLALAAPQEGGGPTPQPPKVEIQTPTAPVVPAKSISSIKEYRGGTETMPYVRRLEDVRELDLSKVDLEGAVLAVINGREIKQPEYRLWLAFAGGQNGVLRSQLVVLTRNAIKRIVDGGGTEAAFGVEDEDVAARIREEEDMARAQGEEYLKQYYSGIEATIGMERYKSFVKAHLQSERLLLPPIVKVDENTTEVSGLPVESAELLDDQPQLREYLNNAYLNGQDFPAMFRTQFLRMLQSKMIDRAEMRYAVEELAGIPAAESVASDTLPEGVYMRVDGTDVPVTDILAYVPEGRDVRERALRLCLLYHAMDDVLAKTPGGLLDPKDFELQFQGHEAEYANTIFPLRNLIQLRGFLNMAEYREYFRRRTAFRLMVEKELGNEQLDAELMAHQQNYGKLFYQSGKVTANILFASLEGAMGEGSDTAAAWQKAKEKIDAACTALKKGEKTIEEARAMTDPLVAEPSGMLSGKMRNEIRSSLGETEYNIFVNGYSLSDDIFYNRVEGEIVGPVQINAGMMPGVKAGLGYMIAVPTEFQTTGPMKPFDVQRQLVHSDYFDLRFTYWAHQCLKDADIELVAVK